MAKAEEIEGLERVSSAVESAELVLRTRFDEMAAAREATFDYTTLDGVHNMRVAMRRLRNALRDLKPILDHKTAKHLAKRLKKIYDIIGAVRDNDVSIQSLGRLRGETDNELVREGIDHLLHDHHKRRSAAREELAAAMTREIFEELEAQLEELFTATRLIEGNADINFCELGARVVDGILKKFDKLSDNLNTPFDIEALHRFRIAAKRLRTALDIFSHCWGDRVQPYIDQCAKMQLLLGKVHDRDEWLLDLAHRVGPENKKILIVDGQAAKWISKELVKKRNEKYLAAVELWREWEAEDFIGSLARLIAQK